MWKCVVVGGGQLRIAEPGLSSHRDKQGGSITQQTPVWGLGSTGLEMFRSGADTPCLPSAGEIISPRLELHRSAYGPG